MVQHQPNMRCKMNKIKVRFHLGAGENYQKWQIKLVNGDTIYVDPSRASLVLYGCKLVNHKATAQRICDGENKTVCAWIECERVCGNYDDDRLEYSEDYPIMYNPKVRPHWSNNEGTSIDNLEFDCIISKGRKLFLNKIIV